ncbi:MAG: hypothetical protein R6V53_07200 [Candidatus Woesearchaeota archaeon]
MSSGDIDGKLESLEKRMDSLEENIKFLKDLLSHIHTQFQDLKKK